ncbi:MAG TPA: HAMP domain-containing sensor histidine kinase [Bacillota bacterium]|nr:HAMP domain-containing sensor histidine kinase [Bacillota bacterium]
MAIKLKDFRKILSWIAFILGVTLTFVSLTIIFDYISLSSQDREQVRSAIKSDLKEKSAFKDTMASLSIYLMESNDSVLREESLIMLNNEGDNLLYYMYNSDLATTTTNMDKPPVLVNSVVSLPEGYDYYIYYNGHTYSGLYKNDLIEFRTDIEGRYIPNLKYSYEEDTYYYKAYLDTRYNMFLAVKENPTEQEGQSMLYGLKQEDNLLKHDLVKKTLIIAASISLLGLAFLGRKDVIRVNKKIVAKISLVKLEYKLILLMMVVLVYDLLSIVYSVAFVQVLHQIMLSLACWWLFYLVLNIISSKKGFISNSYAIGIPEKLGQRLKGKPLPKMMQYKLIYYVCLNLLLALATVLLFFLVYSFPSISLGLLFLISITATVYLVTMSVRESNHFVDNLCVLDNHLARIKEGDYKTQLESQDYKTLHQLADDLGHIQDGMSHTLDSMLKSERTKVELITNVSHDLKTPLTSIISYVDLLLKEEDLPDHARDYVKVLQKKSDRLKLLIQDVFDLSKAASGEMKLNIKTLDLGRLINQIIADTNDSIAASSLDYKVSTPVSTAYIEGDSDKLYRVFMNLIQNTLKFSQDNTRVYIDVLNFSDYGLVEFKNISNYEMNFNEKNILDRFVKGDISRSTEGSGLGLAIAKSFIELLDGDLEIKVDGDLFKVLIKLPKPPFTTE